jgi:hypothetical protein
LDLCSLTSFSGNPGTDGQAAGRPLPRGLALR